MLQKHEITPSVSRRGDCWDNAVAGSFLRTLKVEKIIGPIKVYMIIKRIISAVFFLFLLNQICYGKEFEFKPLNLTNQDRILILAPHPDDEAIGAAGVIQKALQDNIPFKIVYLTNGDNNEPSFIVNQKRLVFRQKAVLMMGQLRGQEAANGMESLGVKKDQLVFLGYPDRGTENIFTSFWSEKKPFKSMLTRVRQVPYKEALSPGAPYLGDSVIKDLKQVITHALSLKPS
ncbi:MAG: PIG-L family deacetylase [Candidatus Omnitrophica bacterium]|nr:PIG-L family deacetylase [Candidatus Omnitrophota bacterium]